MNVTHSTAITADKLFFGHDICGTGGWEAPA
jgi:hypothetical protein